MIRASGRSHVGNVRTRNEDRFGISESARLIFVADGVGGHPAGDIASAVVADYLLQSTTLRDGKAIPADLLEQLRAQLAAHVRANPQHAGLGTTLTLAKVTGSELHVFHIGDSRGYIFEAGTLRPLTEDHSLVGDWVRAGLMSREQGRVHPQSNIITRLISSDSSDDDPDVFQVPVSAGARILLATDGLTDAVPEADIEAICAATRDRDALADRLVERALLGGGRDNITLIVADLLPEEPQT